MNPPSRRCAASSRISLLDSEIDDFIGSLRFERSMAENTCAAYARDLRSFSAFLRKRGISAANEARRDDIADYLGEEREKGRKSTTRARRTAAIRMFFKFLKERRYVNSNPAELLDAPKKTKALPKNVVVDLKSEANVSAKTAVKYKKANEAGGKKIVVNPKTGEVMLRKGLAAGTYNVRVKLTAAASVNYKVAKPKTITLTVKVK